MKFLQILVKGKKDDTRSMKIDKAYLQLLIEPEVDKLYM
jgi:hypothetical protein